MDPYSPNKLFGTSKYCFLILGDDTCFFSFISLLFVFFFFFWLFFVIFNFYQIFLVLFSIFIYLYIYIFIYFLFFIFLRSGMFWHVPACSVFRVLSTPGAVFRLLSTPGAVSQGTVIQDFLLCFTVAELLFVCLFVMEKG